MDKSKNLGLIQIKVPGFYLSGDFPIHQLPKLLAFALECIDPEKVTAIVEYDAEFAFWQMVRR